MENSDRNCVIKFTKNIKKREEEEFQAFPATSFKIFHKNFVLQEDYDHYGKFR